MIGIKEMIIVRKHERPTVKEKWCPEQVEDFQRIITLVEELISTAVASSHSPQQYFSMQNAKEIFINEFLDMADNYRRIS